MELHAALLDADPEPATDAGLRFDTEAPGGPGRSDAVRRFEAVYGPELVDGPVVFTDYVLVADNRRP